LLLRNRALARSLARPRVGPRALTTHGQPAAMTHAAVTADLHQPLDVHRDFFAQVPFDAPLLLDDAADLPDVVFGQILYADVGTDARVREDPVRPDAADSINIGKTDFDALGARKIDACNSCHSPTPAAV